MNLARLWAAVVCVEMLMFGFNATQGSSQTIAMQAWQGKWIQAPFSTENDGATQPMPVFRKSFSLSQKPAKALLMISGLGQYEVHVNGITPKGNGLAPAWTNYKKTVIYDTYDVTRSLVRGENVLGVLLGNGMYNVRKTSKRYTKFEGTFGAPKLIAELRMTFADGTTRAIASDMTWKTSQGPITFSSTYGGEDFDARRVEAGWDSARSVRFNDSSWKDAVLVDGPGGILTEAIAPSVDVVGRHEVVRKSEPMAGKVVYDLGENFAGKPEVHVRGPKGATLKIIPGELLNPDGTVSQRSSGGPQWWSYTLSGNGEETWTPKFSYYGFRYLQAEWVGDLLANASKPQLLSVSGLAVHTTSREIGTFSSSSEMLNSIHQLIVRAMHNNEVSLFTDCPHREKLGWLEETHLVAPGLMFNNDLQKLFAATERNMADAQHDDGLVPTIAPQYTVFGPKYSIFDDSPEWGSASILAAWSSYRFYGDRSDLEHAYPMMQRYIAFLEGHAKNGIVAYGLGDWYDIGPGEPGVSKQTTLGVTGTLMLYQDAVAMGKIARLLGNGEDGVKYDTLAAREKDAFNKRFWDASKRWYDKGSQTANAMPLDLGIVPEEHRAAVIDHVVADIHSHNGHVTTGEVGYPYMLRALMEAGRNDVLLAMMLRKDAPSYGSQLEAGATSLTEAWDANPRSSQDHFMLGGAEEWFYRGLGGIDFDMSRPVDERITIHPRTVARLDWVKCTYDSKLGMVRSSWRRQNGTMTIEVTVPVRATVWVPGDESAITSNTTKNLTRLRSESGAMLYRVGPGTYRFVIRGK